MGQKRPIRKLLAWVLGIRIVIEKIQKAETAECDSPAFAGKLATQLIEIRFDGFKLATRIDPLLNIAVPLDLVSVSAIDLRQRLKLPFARPLLSREFRRC